MSKRLVTEFIRGINEHNVEALSELMSEDHRFIDALGAEVKGRDVMKRGWVGYFKWFPDYKIECTQILESGNTFGIFGFAIGTYSGTDTRENHWRLPAAWRLVAENGLVKEWQVYCDTKTVFEILEKNK